MRVPRLIGVARMTDLMLTGRRYDADEGQAVGISQYLVDEGTAGEGRWSWPGASPTNAPQTNFAVVQALPRIAEANPREGYFMEALMAADRAGHRRCQGAHAGVPGRSRRAGDRPVNDHGLGSWPRARAA